MKVELGFVMGLVMLTTAGIAHAQHATLNSIQVSESVTTDRVWTELAVSDLRVNATGSRLVEPALLIQANEVDELWVRLTDHSLLEKCYSYPDKIFVTHSSEQEIFDLYLPNGRGDFVLNQNRVEWVQFNVTSSALGRCRLQLFGRSNDENEEEPNPEPGEGFDPIGALHYLGGYADQLTINLVDAQSVQQLWLRIPSFCEGLEVLEVGTVTEGILDPVQLIDADRHLYQVGSGEEGRRIRAIQVAINGPLDAACDIPVYVKKI